MSPGVAYTIATGRLFCDMCELYEVAARLLQRPVYTHEFADRALWEALRERAEAEFEASAIGSGR